MKILVSYYSRTGANKLVAKYIAKKVKADIEIIKESNSMPKNIFLSLLNLGCKIGSLRYDPSNYDLVFVISPMWINNLPCPINKYLRKNKRKFKKLVFVSLSGSGDNKKGICSVKNKAKVIPLKVLELKLPDGCFDEKTLKTDLKDVDFCKDKIDVLLRSLKL